MRDTKQVIVFRTEFPNSKGGIKKMSKGKMIAQGSHASMAFLSSEMAYSIEQVKHSAALASPRPEAVLDGVSFSARFTEAQRHWLTNSFAKVCLQVKTEEELDAVHDLALAAGMTVHKIVDSGRTEFDGVPTATCVAIGPDWVDMFEGITDDLRML